MKLRRLLVPLYVLLCIFAGGSGQQGIWANLGLQLLALAILVWAISTRASDELTRSSKQLLLLLALVIILALCQLVPLPPFVWTSLAGRDVVVSGYEALGFELPSLPISLAPYDTAATLLALLPPVAVLIATLRVRQSEEYSTVAILLAVFCAVLLGAMQVASGDHKDLSWYFYRHTNDGAVGFFANRNHMGSLLLVSIPFGVALISSAMSRSTLKRRTSGMLALGAGALLIATVGIALNRSLAAIVLAIPVLIVSSLLLPAGWRLRRLAIPVGTVAVVGCLIALTSAHFRRTCRHQLKLL